VPGYGAVVQVVVSSQFAEGTLPIELRLAPFCH